MSTFANQWRTIMTMLLFWLVLFFYTATGFFLWGWTNYNFKENFQVPDNGREDLIRFLFLLMYIFFPSIGFGYSMVVFHQLGIKPGLGLDFD